MGMKLLAGGRRGLDGTMRMMPMMRKKEGMDGWTTSTITTMTIPHNAEEERKSGKRWKQHCVPITEMNEHTPIRSLTVFLHKSVKNQYSLDLLSLHYSTLYATVNMSGLICSVLFCSGLICSVLFWSGPV